MHFSMVDAVIERTPQRIVTAKSVSAAEEYLQDHFAGFPVLPGVFMIESLVQAARRLVQEAATAPAADRLVLGGVRAVKYGRFVRPGETLIVEVELIREASGVFDFRGEGKVRGTDGVMVEGATAVSGRFSLRPPVLSAP